jgi:renalase
MKTGVLIIGAGLTGLVLANRVNRSALILEKSKGVGGRVATRRIEEMGLDHGAPYLFEHPDVISLLKLHQIEFKSSPSGLYVEGGMTKMAKTLSEGVSIRKGIRAQKLTRSSDGWEVLGDNGELFLCQDLVITAPLPQALELLSSSSIEAPSELHSITYSKAVMALIILNEGSLEDQLLPEEIHSILNLKERGLHPHGYIIRGTPAFSEKIFEQSEQVILEKLQALFKASFKTPPVIRYSELKKWRYVHPQTALPYAYCEICPHLYLAGDAFIAPDASGAVRSAVALSEKL